MAEEISDDKVDLMTKQITITKLLASNDPKIRSDGIKQMKQLIQSNSGDTNDGWFNLFGLFENDHFIYDAIEIII